MPYFNPHSLRDMLTLLGEQICRTPEEFKAWSQNLGHEKVMTTFRSYGEVAERRQAEIIRSLGTGKSGIDHDETVAELAKLVACLKEGDRAQPRAGS